MYIWVLLATFIAMIASFNLPARNDAKELLVEPLAAAHISKIATVHRAALKYIEENSPPKINSTIMSYSNGQAIPNARIEEYLPYGAIIDPDYTSRVYCMRKSDYSAIANCQGDATAVLRVVITYGFIPQKWMNTSTGGPNNNYLSAMHNVVASGVPLGYVDLNTTDPNRYGGSELEIRGRSDSLVPIPNAIGRDSYFGRNCNPNMADESSPYCIAFSSTL